MDASIRYGFLAVVFNQTLGYTGGLLVVDQDGKPLEFHCTAPVIENRTQQILFGKTYRSHIFCDLIGEALVDKCSVKPELLFVSQEELRQLTSRITPPVLVVADNTEHAGSEAGQRRAIEYPEFGVDHLNVTVLTIDLEQFEFVKAACERFTTTITLDEPFDRIREAIGEAHNVARQSDAA